MDVSRVRVIIQLNKDLFVLRATGTETLEARLLFVICTPDN